MSRLLMSLIAFTCIFGCTFIGIFIRYRLPDRHLSSDTRDIVRQGTGLIGALASLVLGLLIASADESSRPRALRSSNSRPTSRCWMVL
jgi:hypothetical protein